MNCRIRASAGGQAPTGCPPRGRVRDVSDLPARLAIAETVILLTLSLSITIDTPAKGGGGDSRMTVSSTARPGWEIATGLDKDGHPVLAAGGGCLGGNAGSGYKADARAFAVALAKPPAPGVQVRAFPSRRRVAQQLPSAGYNRFGCCRVARQGSAWSGCTHRTTTSPSEQTSWHGSAARPGTTARSPRGTGTPRSPSSPSANSLSLTDGGSSSR